MHNILIADRNPRVRDLLKREMAKHGYRVQLAENGGQIIRDVYGNKPVDLLIIDPDIPGMARSLLIEKLRNRIPCLSVIIHAHAANDIEAWNVLQLKAFVEKGERSIERLKQIVDKMSVKKR